MQTGFQARSGSCRFLGLVSVYVFGTKFVFADALIAALLGGEGCRRKESLRRARPLVLCSSPLSHEDHAVSIATWR